MLVLPTDWSPRKTSLYLARAETGAMDLGRDLAGDESDRSRPRSLGWELNSLLCFLLADFGLGAYLYYDLFPETETERDRVKLV